MQMVFKGRETALRAIALGFRSPPLPYTQKPTVSTRIPEEDKERSLGGRFVSRITLGVGPSFCPRGYTTKSHTDCTSRAQGWHVS